MRNYLGLLLMSLRVARTYNLGQVGFQELQVQVVFDVPSW
jgi:hypothetical protein